MHRTQTGLTLIETLIALALLAILLSLAVPSFHGNIQQQRVATVANELITTLHLARSTAIRDRQRVTVCPSHDGMSCTGGNQWHEGWIVYRDPNAQPQPASPDDVLRVVQAREGVYMHSAGRTRTRFRPDGAAYGTNLTIRICDTSGHDHHRAIIVSNPGRARTETDLPASECPPGFG